MSTRETTTIDEKHVEHHDQTYKVPEWVIEEIYTITKKAETEEAFRNAIASDIDISISSQRKDVPTANKAKEPYNKCSTFKNLLYAASHGYPKLLDFLSTYESTDFSGIIDINDERTNSILKLLATSFDPYLSRKSNMLKAAQMLSSHSLELTKVEHALQNADPHTEVPDNLSMSKTSHPASQNEEWEVFSLLRYMER